jgi:hypothetical protein
VSLTPGSFFSLFNDTTRLRLKNRPSLAANMFFNEAPTASLKPEMAIYNDESGKARCPWHGINFFSSSLLQKARAFVPDKLVSGCSNDWE